MFNYHPLIVGIALTFLFFIVIPLWVYIISGMVSGGWLRGKFHALSKLKEKEIKDVR